MKILTSEVLTFSTGTQVKQGEIWTDGDRIACTPAESELLQGIMQEPIYVGRSRKEVTAASPNAFVKGLAEYYSGAMLRCTKAEQR